MAWQAWTTVSVVLIVIGVLATTRLPADAVLLGALTLLLTLGVVSPAEALAGFANEGLVTVAVLYVVATGVRETGAMSWAARRLLGRPRSVAEAQARLALPVAAASAFANKTPVVAMMLPVVADWARKHQIPASKLMIPLSYAAILGGLCTLIGTSTNLVVSGLLTGQAGKPGLGLFEVTWIGLPCAVAGLTYLLLCGRLLPDRGGPAHLRDDPRQYTVEMLIDATSELVGRTIEEAGLRNLPGLYLAEIDRDGQVLPAVGPQERLRGGDRLVFVGVVESVVHLHKLRGLEPATDQVFKLDAPRSQRCLIEAVVSDSCPLVGRTVREGRFRTLYDAAVIAVARNGERLRQKIGDVVLRAGDTLLLEAHPSFAARQRDSRDFYLVSTVEGSTPPAHERAWVALAILAAMVVMVGAGWLSMLQAALWAAGLMVLTRCCTPAAARRGVDWSVLVVIAAAFGVGGALRASGAAAAIAGTLIGAAGNHPWAVLAVVYAVTMVFTECMSHAAAAALVFPITMGTAEALQVSYMPFVMAIMMAASCGFAAPISHQIHLMVYGPGGYRYSDFLRFGGPLDLVVGAVTVALAPLIWPF